MTCRALLNYGAMQLREADISDADVDAWILLQFVTGLDRTRYLMDSEQKVSEAQEAMYFRCIEKRKTHYPLQYITNSQEFMGLEFYVDERVLVPRQDTEVLVELVLSYLKDGMSVMDMCTGSGCILLSIASYRKLKAGYGIDVSPDALEVAEINRQQLGLENIQLIHSSLFEQLNRDDILRLDMLISNPPYIASDVISTLMPEVRDHEPMLALDGMADGLYFYREITKQAPLWLKSGGMLFFEIGYDQGAPVSALMQEAGFKNIQIHKDLAGLDRVVCGQLG